MSDLTTWLEAHENLAGWAQFFGAMLALAVTYLTAFSPVWRRKRQLHGAAIRLLSHGYEAIESYHRTSANFLPFALSVRFASLTMKSMSEEISRFPIYEMDDHGSYSLARRLVSMGQVLGGLSLFLDNAASDLEGREGTIDDQNGIRSFIGQQIPMAANLVTGAELKRPEWSPGPDYGMMPNNVPSS